MTPDDPLPPALARSPRVANDLAKINAHYRDDPKTAQAAVQQYLRREMAKLPDMAGVPATTSDAVAGRAGEGAGSREGLTPAQGVRLVAQGASFGGSDEIEAGLRALGPETYDEAVGKVRGDLRQARQVSPVGSAALEVAGGVVPAFLPGVGPVLRGGKAVQGAAQGAGLLRRMQPLAESVAANAGASGLTGFLTEEGGLGARATAAGQYGAVGAGMGLAAPIIGQGLRRTGQALASPTASALEATGGMLLTGRARQAATTGATNLRGVVEEALAEKADRRVARAMAADAKTGALRTTAAPDDALLDLGGKQTQRLARATASIPNSTADQRFSDLLNARLGTPQAADLSSDVARSFGVSRDGVLETADQIAARQSLAATPLYDAARQAPQFYDPNIGRFLDSPAGRAAAGRAERMSGNRQAAFGEPPLRLRPTTIGRKTMYMPDVNTVDLLKRGLDDELNQLTLRGATDEIATAGVLKNRLTQQADAVVPEYPQARAVYGGAETQKEALAAGARWRSQTPEEISRFMQGATPSEREFFRQSMAKGIEEELLRATGGNEPRNVAAKLLDGATERRIRAAFGDDVAGADALVGRIRRSQERGALAGKVLPSSGSQTTPRAQDVAEYYPESGARQVLRSGNMTLTGLAGRALDAGLDRVERIGLSDIADRVTDRLLLQGEDLSTYLRNRQANDTRRAAASLRIGRTAGTTVGRVGVAGSLRD